MLSDKKIKSLSKLSIKKGRETEGKFLVEGFRIIQSFIPMLGENEFHIWNQSFSLFLPYSKTVTLALNTTMQKKYGYKNGDLPVTEKVSNCILRLPI